MATLSPTHTDLPRPDGVVYAPVPKARREEALGMLLTGSTRGARASVEHFMGFAAQQSLAIDQLWGAFDGSVRGEVVSSSLVVPCTGRTAIVFLSPAPLSILTAIQAELVRRAVAALDPRRVRLAQALLESQQASQLQAFTAAGFQRLAHLIYMQRSTASPAPLEYPTLVERLEPGVEVVTWSESRRGLFHDAIVASYEQTLDCPGLLGLRQVDDVIDGHMATGEFVPALWLALHKAGEPVGVMLLNLVMQRQNMELVYLGLSRSWRGRGLGRALVNHALHLAHERRTEHLMLAVDELNTAALKMYRSLGFNATVRKLALVQPL